MYFADLHPNSGCGCDLVRFRIDKGTGNNAGIAQLADNSLQPCFLTNDIQTTFGCYFLTSFRYEHGHFRLELTGNADHFIGSRHFQIQFDLGQITQLAHVGILNMTPVFAQVNRNAISSTQMGFNSCPDRIRFIGSSCLT